MRITLANDDTRYGASLETDSLNVEIYEAFDGPIFWTSDGEGLGVCMRDSGFEVAYVVNDQTVHVTLNNGEIFVGGVRANPQGSDER